MRFKFRSFFSPIIFPNLNYLLTFHHNYTRGGFNIFDQIFFRILHFG
ncbi:hypothetical protein Hanom_Chr14g01318661 [Helianthus anomalus]